MSKVNDEANISDLRDKNRILNQVHNKDSKIRYTHIRNKEELVIIGLRDA